MPDAHRIADLGPFFNDRAAQRPFVDVGVGPHFHVVFQDGIADMGKFDPFPLLVFGVAGTVVADDAAGMDLDVFPQQRAVIEIAVPPDQRSGPDAALADITERPDVDIRGQLCFRVHKGGGVDLPLRPRREEGAHQQRKDQLGIVAADEALLRQQRRRDLHCRAANDRAGGGAAHQGHGIISRRPDPHQGARPGLIEGAGVAKRQRSGIPADLVFLTGKNFLHGADIVDFLFGGIWHGC